jgi:hypothetical protein
MTTTRPSNSEAIGSTATSIEARVLLSRDRFVNPHSGALPPEPDRRLAICRVHLRRNLGERPRVPSAGVIHARFLVFVNDFAKIGSTQGATNRILVSFFAPIGRKEQRTKTRRVVLPFFEGAGRLAEA